MKHSPIDNYRRACDRAGKRFKDDTAESEARLVKEQAKCPHKETGYEPDSAGGRDGYIECLRCGKHLSKKDLR